MARKIRSIAELGNVPVEELNPGEGVVFINNYTNRKFVFKDGTVHQFKATREVHTDPQLIANLTELAKNKENKIFIETPPEDDSSESDETAQ